ncbi:MAG TPA: glycyl-radical enzyme activating protein [Bacteroidales bacterium]|nr:glycyl-radical enzyme activating protein [Bacteroidales bacterium]
MKGKVFRIKRFSIHDGPGIRTTVFLKGCAMRCVWCHNPEGLNEEPEVWHDKTTCIACGRCVESCSTGALTLVNEDHNVIIDRKLCKLNGDCVRICPTGAMQFTAKEMTTEEVVAEIEKDRIFYETSDGGVTLSGGEPLFQPDFSASIFKECRKKGIHTAVETCLLGYWHMIEQFIEDIDLFLVDLKIFDQENHIKFTGHTNNLILKNFKMLASTGRDIRVRIPLVKNITDTPENISAITGFVHSVNPEIPIEKIKYNPLARNNYDRLGIPFILSE